MAEPPRKRQRRHLNFDKCRFCRNAKKACKPVERIWPQKCDRCVELELECSENSRAAGAPPSLTVQPNNQTVDIKTIHSVSLRLAWVSRLTFYREATVASVYARERSHNSRLYKDIVLQKFKVIRNEETSFFNDFFDETTPNNPLAAFVPLALGAHGNFFEQYPGDRSPWKFAKAKAKVDDFLERGDISTALAMQEIVLLHELQEERRGVMAVELQKYCDIYSEMTRRLNAELSRELPAVPPLHLLSLMTKGELISQITSDYCRFFAMKDCFGRSLLHIALDLGVAANVLKSVAFDISTATGDAWGRWPIHIACSGDSEAVAEYVLSKTVSHDNDCLERSALHYAIRSGHESTFQLLIRRGASVSRPDIQDRTPLSWAAEYGRTGIVNLLLENNTNVNFQDFIQQTALHKGVQHGHTAVVKLLLENNANIDCQDHHGETALYKAADRGHTAIVKLLLENNAKTNPKGLCGETALHKGAQHGHTAVVNLLLENNANMDSQDHHGERALSKAARNGHTAVVKLLLENNPEINTKDLYKETALHKGARSGHTAVVELLLENNADINSRNFSGETALYKAIGGGHTAIVKLLLEDNADMNPQNYYGETALYKAVGGGHTAVVELLLEGGADPNTRSRPSGLSLIEVAISEGRTEVAELLRSWGAELIDISRPGASSSSAGSV